MMYLVFAVWLDFTGFAAQVSPFQLASGILYHCWPLVNLPMWFYLERVRDVNIDYSLERLTHTTNGYPSK